MPARTKRRANRVRDGLADRLGGGQHLRHDRRLQRPPANRHDLDQSSRVGG